MVSEKEVSLLLNSITGNNFYFDFVVFFFAQVFPYIVIFSLLFLFFRNRKKYGILVVQASVSALMAKYLVVETIRHFCPRLRPFEVIDSINLILPLKDSFSFPSGHAAIIFAISTIAYYHHQKVGTIMFLLAFIMGISRIVSGIHWPLDIVAGGLIGILCAVAVVELYNYLFDKKKTS